jgi:hypothetical protein
MKHETMCVADKTFRVASAHHVKSSIDMLCAQVVYVILWQHRGFLCLGGGILFLCIFWNLLKVQKQM